MLYVLTLGIWLLPKLLIIINDSINTVFFQTESLFCFIYRSMMSYNCLKQIMSVKLSYFAIQSVFLSNNSGVDNIHVEHKWLMLHF